MAYPNTKATLKVLLLQLNANNSVAKTNIREKIVAMLDAKNLNSGPNSGSKLIVFPELSYHRYLFQKREDAKSDDSLLEYLKFLSKRYNSYVVSGFVEEKKDRKYNSSVCIYGDEIVSLHRKKHLYYTDEVWADEGDSFTSFQMRLNSERAITCSMAICMDINPYRFEAPFEKYEYSTFCRDAGVDLAIVPTAWTHQLSVLQGEDREGESGVKKRAYLRTLGDKYPWLLNPNLAAARGAESRFLFAPCHATLNYWYARFQPMHAEHNRYLLFCDKVGIEGDVLYAGSSTCLRLDRGDVAVQGCLSTAEEAVLEVDLAF